MAGVVGLLNALSTIVPHWTLADHRPPVILVPIIFGCACLAGTVAVAHLAAVLVGFIQSLRYERNLLPASMQMSAYLSGYLLLWAVFGAGSTAGLISLDSSGWLRQFQDVTGLMPGEQFILLFVVPNLAWGVVYLILVARGTAAARYANR